MSDGAPHHTGLWNWPFNRQDMEVYGKLGYTITENTTTMRLHTGMMKDEQRAKGLAVYEDLFSCFADVVKEE